MKTLLIALILSGLTSVLFIQEQCVGIEKELSGAQLRLPKLHNLSERIYTKYQRIPRTKLINSGGAALQKCEAYNFPIGLMVRVSKDNQTCVISGIPAQEQVFTKGFIVASNQQGSSLAVVPISVNALQLDE